MPGIDGVEAARQIGASELRAQPGLIMVTAYGQAEVAEAAKGVGIEVSLAKPVTPSHLLDASLNVLGLADVTERVVKEVLVDMSAIAGAKILLVEDNDVNRQIADELLRSEGLDVTHAEDGRQAVRAVQQNTYDAVLMDLQMPVMGGIDATKEIKKDGQFEHLPIIAMTANAMEEDRKRCLEVGMVDHVAKPIEPNVLFETLLKWIPAKDGPDDASATGPSSTAADVSEDGAVPILIEGVDVESGLRRMRGKRALYVRILRQFVRDSEQPLARTIRDRMEGDDLEGARRAVHSLKSVVGTLGATHVEQRAAEIESSLAETTQSDDPLDRLDLLQASLDDLTSAIEGALALEPSDPGEEDSLAVPSDPDELLDELERLLEEFDSSAVEYVHASSDRLASVLGDGYSEFEKLIDMWDLSAAYDWLREARGGIAAASTD